MHELILDLLPASYDAKIDESMRLEKDNEPGSRWPDVAKSRPD